MRPKIVGVIFSRADLQHALRMRKPPDLFELRLDAFADGHAELQPAITRLPAPLIITARHPREGGANNLSLPRRRELLLSYLPQAAWVDVELRSAVSLRSLLQSARATAVRIILSFHDFGGTPSAARLDKVASAAESLGADLLKVATRTDSTSEMGRLLDFFERQKERSKIVAMGIGKLGKLSRLELFRRGCALNYAPLGRPQAPGQLSIAQLRRLRMKASARFGRR